MKIIKYALLIMLVLCGIGLSQALAEDLASKEYDLGITLGMWFPGTISIEDVDVDKGGSLFLRAFADMYVAPKFAVGIFGNYSKFTIKEDYYIPDGVDCTTYEFGMSLKPRILLSPGVALKPGLNIGYRNVKTESIGYSDTTADGMGIDLSVELQIALEGGYIFHIDGGFLSQPVGGTDDADVTWAPIMYLGVGITF